MSIDRKKPTREKRVGFFVRITRFYCLQRKALFRYRAQSLGNAAFWKRKQVLFDTFSLGKKYYAPVSSTMKEWLSLA